ncbi:related to COP9-signalosome complex subunit 4 [Sporisorium scitamineum]|uniref:COP9 signalosome complex subunit 4 n=1 Tax=Sporisorium scitamineum TaxID=49012 RepID=A0A127Z3M0_9BASI|nr:related to COP9-signalosome complex subunit 4 [Sporisorium scitamineum]
MSSTLESFTAQLQHVATQPNNARLAAYDSLISGLLQKPSSKLSRNDVLEATSAYLRHAVFSEQNSTGGGLVIGRQALTALEHHAGRIAEEYESKQRDNDRMQDDEDDGSAPSIVDRDTRRQLLENALEQLQPRVLSFEEQASSLRIQLAGLLEAEEDWNEAARVLLAIPLDSGHRNVSDHFKLSIYVRIVRLLLEGDDPVAADMYLKRASMIIHNVPGALPSQYQQQQQQQQEQQQAAEAATTTSAGEDATETASAAGASGSKQKLEDPKILGLQYRLSQARVYDSQRRFSEAAIRYHELSYVAEIDEDDRAMMLSAAVTAAILSPAGPQRARTLAMLMRDERTPSLPQYTILSKVFLDRVIRPDEIASFEKLLSPHQIAKLGSSSQPAVAASALTDTSEAGTSKAVRHAPSTVLDRAMIEHNVLSASRLYDNITLAGLGALVDLSPEGAEDIARKMIMQGRLKGWIDQVGSTSTGETGAREGGVLFFVDQERRGEGETTAGGLEATKVESSGADGGSGGGGGVGEGGANGGTGAGDVDTKWTRRWDQQIGQVTGALEDVCQRINKISATTTTSVAA